MNEQELLDYQRIADAIQYIRQNFKKQPDLNEVAAKVHLSPFHFQRLFTRWAGISPKKFLAYMSIEYAKKVLNSGQATLFDAAFETGLSGTSRLHELFVQIEGMTPGEYKNGCALLHINYSFVPGPFGNLLVASTSKGVCYMAFADDILQALNDMKSRFPNARFSERNDAFQQQAVKFFQIDPYEPQKIRLHLKGTKFQLKVWEALLKIPAGKLTSYGEIAAIIESPKASRAVGNAVANNPVAFLIPCHRVIQSSGIIGGYMWGETRKSIMIGWEAAQYNS